jgi:hypothetical protein
VAQQARQVSASVFVAMQGRNSCRHWKSRVLVVAWSHVFYSICIQIFKLLFIHVYIIYKYQFIAKSQTVAFGNSHLLATLQIDANQCRSMCDLQRLSRTTFLHLSVPLSSERQLNCWASDMVCSANQLILFLAGSNSCEFHTKQWGAALNIHLYSDLNSEWWIIHTCIQTQTVNSEQFIIPSREWIVNSSGFQARSE